MEHNAGWRWQFPCAAHAGSSGVALSSLGIFATPTIFMSDQPIVGKKEMLTALGTGLGIGLSVWIASIASPKGVVALQSRTLLEIAGAVSWLFVGLGAYAFQLWRRDRKRERIRFAREMGRSICGCTETGEIRLLRRTETMYREYVCPKCGDFQIVMTDMKA